MQHSMQFSLAVRFSPKRVRIVEQRPLESEHGMGRRTNQRCPRLFREKGTDMNKSIYIYDNKHFTALCLPHPDILSNTFQQVNPRVWILRGSWFQYVGPFVYRSVIPLFVPTI